jgi:predicted transcriptional regulator of viral defense system
MLVNKLQKHFQKKTFTPKEAAALGISARMLNHFFKKGEIHKVGRGLYSFVEFSPDEADWKYYDLAMATKSYKGAVICLISALNYWNLTEEFERSFWLAFPNNRPAIKNEAIRMYRPRNLSIGVIEIKLAGVKVKITDIERSIIDAFKYLDEESSITSLRLYLAQEEGKIHMAKLIDYAIKLREIKILRIINEIASSQAKSYPVIKGQAFKDTIREISKMRKAI